MKAEIYSLSWPNSDVRIEEAQDRVFRHFQIPLVRHKIHMRHGLWMNEVLRKSSADVLGFVDNDCIPLNAEIVHYTMNYVGKFKSFYGIAQASNHIGTRSHIFAAPAFYFIYRQSWFDLGCPTFAETERSDVAEEVSYVAEEKGLRYRAYYPTHFEAEPREGVWRLSNFGFFGIGTVFAGSIYHLYQGRFKENVDRFELCADRVVNGTFSTSGMFSSQEHYEGRIVP